MIRGENSDSIPIDLITEILSRLPAKSIARFRCVSKLWRSMLLRPYFAELFLTKSTLRPRLLFSFERSLSGWFVFSSPQPQNPYDSSLVVVTADSHMKFLGDNMWLDLRGHASGLIYFRQLYMPISEVICNPSTGHHASFPTPNDWRSLLGFDPIDKQFKLLSVDQILTLGTENDSWRKIHCPLHHYPTSEGICINGVLYYLAEPVNLIVCFDVRSEKFKFIYRDCSCDAKLINYKGKLGVITMEYDYDDHRRGPSLELCMWVIKDVEKPESSEWSKYLFTIRDDKVVDVCNLSIVGVTAGTSEIVFSMKYASNPFYVFFFNTERNTIQSVEIQGLGASGDKCRKVNVFVDHVEDLKFINTRTTSISKAHPSLMNGIFPSLE